VYAYAQTCSSDDCLLRLRDRSHRALVRLADAAWRLPGAIERRLFGHCSRNGFNSSIDYRYFDRHNERRDAVRLAGFCGESGAALSINLFAISGSDDEDRQYVVLDLVQNSEVTLPDAVLLARPR